jgi:hypothetical protein
MDGILAPGADAASTRVDQIHPKVESECGCESGV